MTAKTPRTGKTGRILDEVFGRIEGLKSSPAVKRLKQRHPELSGFIERRFSPDFYLGLHLTAGLVVSAVLVWIFGSITDEVLEYDTLVRVDHWITAYVDSIRSPLADRIMVAVTHLGGRYVLPLGTLIVIVLLLAAGRYAPAAGFFVANAGGYLLVAVLKLTIRRERPLMEVTHVEVAGFSYPSGHAMMAVIFYGMLAYLVVRTAQPGVPRAVVVCAAGIVILLIGISRIYLGVHYISDVAAGFAGGLFWLTVCITGLEIERAKTRGTLGTTAGESE